MKMLKNKEEPRGSECRGKATSKSVTVQTKKRLASAMIDHGGCVMQRV